MNIAKNREQLIGNLVKMCCRKTDRNYPKEKKNPVNVNEFTWPRLTMTKGQEIELIYFMLVSAFYLLLFSENRK